MSYKPHRIKSPMRYFFFIFRNLKIDIIYMSNGFAQKKKCKVIELLGKTKCGSVMY